MQASRLEDGDSTGSGAAAVVPDPDHRRPSRAVSAGEDALRLGLLRGFELRRGDSVVRLPVSAQRVLAFLALHDRPLQRLYVAGSLWLDSSETNANACLRTALWRLGRPDCVLVDASPTHLALAPGVDVDLREARAAAESVIDGEVAAAGDALYGAGELLPDWYDDWVLIEREHFRQLRLHALELLCSELTGDGRFAEAVRAGQAAVRGEPLRESAHRALIRAHLAEGNPGEALRQYHLFRRLLADELGLEPSQLMADLMQALPIR